jgi:glycosyltransferase involved in cell wall biosynthesis
VLTPVLNEAAHIRQAVAGMQRQEFAGDLEFLFIDGGSDDDTVAILEELQQGDTRIRILHNPERRTPNALNLGLQDASGTYVARMDAHTLYPPSYLAKGVERLERGDAAWVSGPQLAEGRGRWSELVALALRSRLGVGGAAFRTEAAAEIEVDSGFTGIWRRDTLERLGGWDVEWPVNQDGELAARVRGEGGRIVCIPEMAARYVPRNSPRSLARQYWRYGQYRVKTSRRHPSSMRRSHLLAPGLVASLLLGVVGRGRVRRLGRAGVLMYLVAVPAESVRLARDRPPGDALRLPAVFSIMHLSWGAGFIAGCLRFGLPVRALVAALAPPPVREGIGGSEANLYTDGHADP